MSGISHIASLTARVGSTGITQQGFGVPLIAGHHTRFPELVRSYEGDPSQILSDMETDGFDTDENMYVMASRLLAQSSKPRTIKVGRLETAHTQTLLITPKNVVEGSVYTLTFYTASGTETATYTVGAAETASDIATALDTAINAFTTCTEIQSTDNTGSLTVDVASAGNTFRMDWDVNSLQRPADLDLLDTTADAGIASDLSAIETEDPDWYALMLDVESVAIATAAAAWAATRDILYLPATSDADATESGTSTDIGSVIVAASNVRCAPVWEPYYRDYSQCALAGTCLPRQPGSITWVHKQLRSVKAANLPSALYTALTNKRYTMLRRLNATQSATWGGHVGGDYIYIDITRGFDWITARGQEAVASLELSNDKVPFTIEGLALIRQALERVVTDAVSLGVLSPGDPSNPVEDPVPAVVLPRIGEAGANLAARTARTLSNVKITGRFGGAVHSVVGEIVLGF